MSASTGDQRPNPDLQDIGGRLPGRLRHRGPDSPIIDLTEPLDLIRGLEERGARYFVQSAAAVHHGGHYAGRQARSYFAYLHPWAKEFKKAAKKAVIGFQHSVFRNGKNAASPWSRKRTRCSSTERNSSGNKVDMIALGAGPSPTRCCLEAARGRENEIKWCTLCDNCRAADPPARDWLLHATSTTSTCSSRREKIRASAHDAHLIENDGGSTMKLGFSRQTMRTCHWKRSQDHGATRVRDGDPGVQRLRAVQL